MCIERYNEDGLIYDGNGDVVPPTDDDYEYWRSEQDTLTNPLSDGYCKYDNE